MSGKKPDRRDVVVENLKAKLDASRETIAAQQQELEQLRAAAVKPRRLFRKRKIEHGPLTITITPSEPDVASSEVHIEQVGNSLLIVVGGSQTETAPIRTHAAQTRAVAAPEIEAAPPVQRTLDAQEAVLKDVGVDGGVLGLFQGASDPRILSLVSGEPNAVIKPGDPRKPGGWQDRSEEQVIARRFEGYTGKGPKPAGWTDPDKVDA